MACEPFRAHATRQGGGVERLNWPSSFVSRFSPRSFSLSLSLSSFAFCTLLDVCEQEIMMDHALRTISYIADIGDLVVLMARRRMITQDGEDSSNKIAKTPKMVCHVFESEEVMNVDCVFCSPSLVLHVCFVLSLFFIGPVYCPVYRPGLSSCLYGIPQSQWHRRSEFRT